MSEDGSKTPWNSHLDNTNDRFINKTFVLPSEIANKQIKVMLYIITNGAGEHVLSVKKAVVL
jgi:hypothetical protein